MRSTSVLVVTAVLLSGGFARAEVAGAVRQSTAIQAGAIQTIGVFFEFQDRPAQLTIDAMESEVQSIMRPIGLTFAWRELGGPQGQGDFADLIVVKFKGSCSGVLPPFGTADRDTEAIPLASTQVSNGYVLHFTEVGCDALRHYLSADAAQLNDAGRSRLYGRALGRIVSHEMWHIFAGTEKHASGGVARACHSREELVQPVFVFKPKEEKILHEYAMRSLLSKEANPEP
jgi:hypothetical protein